jgi:hypothetical protein
MITVKIGNEERPFDGRPHWIQEQLDGRRKEQQNICVRVFIDCGKIRMSLSTPACLSSEGGGTRAPNDVEREIFELWSSLKLNSEAFTSGNLIAFLKQVARFC